MALFRIEPICANMGYSHILKGIELELSSNFRRVQSIQNINSTFHLDYDSVFNEVDHALIWVNECKGNYYNYCEL